MVKLQKVNSQGNTERYSVNIPKDIIDRTGMQKGDDLTVYAMKTGNVFRIILIKTKDVGEQLEQD